MSVRAALFAQDVIVDNGSLHHSLIRVFSHVHTRVFPITANRLWVHYSLSEAEGVRIWRVEVEGPDAKIIRNTGDCYQTNALRGDVTQLSIALDNLSFSTPGLYMFNLYEGTNLRASAALYVVKSM